MEIFFTAITLIIIVIVLMNEFFQQKLKVSPMPSMAAVRNKMIEIIPDEVNGSIVELGSGGGGLSILAAKKYPNNQVVGYELSIFPYIISKIKQIFYKGNLKFICKNFHDADFSKVGVIICYLSNPIMAELKDKLLKELPKGAIIISSTFFIPDWKEEEIITVKGMWNTKIFVYKKS